MKKYYSILLILGSGVMSWACDQCNAGSNRSEFWEIFSHGQGPEGNFDYLIFGVGIVIVLFTAFYSLKFLIFPKEKNKSHIKYSILKD